MHRFLSQKFKFFSFVCISLLLFVHGYNLQVTYLTPFSIVEEKLTFTTFIEYLLANGLLRFRIPMLFAISGYIFAIQDHRPFGQRVKKRALTLLLPYFIWGAIGLAITFLLQQFPLTAQAVSKANLDQLGDNRPYSQIGWGGVLYRWLLAPPSFQLWFIRSLFVYNLLYPVFRWGVTKFPIASFALLFLFWGTLLQLPLLEGQGMFFFALGIWLQKRSYPLERKPEWYSDTLSWLVFVGICVIKTFMAFEFDQVTPTVKWALSVLHVLATASGVLAVWFSSDKIVVWFMQQKWFVWATSFSFFIYGFHVPLLAYLTALFFMFGSSFQWYRLSTYLLAPTLMLLVCILAGALLRMTLPGLYKVITGGRGF
ncbi:MAG TPA: acyltransferase [Flavisolibacter sp.]|jgi:fucose 4-O-acetylase-like acetyltransferase|nr:acyltransferase [Flavisolibacter sp.]